jgi:aryl-alcohol dehydrogenase-like predicted oxidoreductase
MNFSPLGRTGLRVSRLSFGASSLGGVFRPVDETQAILQPVMNRQWTY